MPELLSFLLTAILVLYIVRAVARILLPMFFQGVVDKAQQQQQNQQRNYNSTPPPGKIKVDYIPKQNKGAVPDSEGEFVDYEEVK